MSNYPSGSMGEQDEKNDILASKIAIAGFVVLHVVSYIISKARLQQVNAHVYLWSLPALAVFSLVFTVKNLVAHSETTELSKWPYVLLIASSFASCWALFWCSAC